MLSVYLEAMAISDIQKEALEHASGQVSEAQKGEIYTQMYMDLENESQDNLSAGSWITLGRCQGEIMIIEKPST